MAACIVDLRYCLKAGTYFETVDCKDSAAGEKSEDDIHEIWLYLFIQSFFILDFAFFNYSFVVFVFQCCSKSIIFIELLPGVVNGSAKMNAKFGFSIIFFNKCRVNLFFIDFIV